ncbi:hypothetical protein GM418_24510 [Maribellus comscasis]|uniref:Uncharacterized protein n=1 Tax=Maribellus comscasis TaxID=2681766 RepID=A0A6I6K509_9BACT|nr:hypothetical protein [Maribellus comscasis]QGY46703.1 hypothetical protein GM418_24510 [Maribellus comscasis]
MNNTKRPDFLSALCILSFIGSGFAFIAYFISSLFFEQVSELIIKYSSWHSTETISPFYFTTLMALYAISLAGAIRIWKFHRDGILIYSAAQILILLLPVFWINGQAFSVTNLIFTAIFILGYAFNWRKLG